MITGIIISNSILKGSGLWDGFLPAAHHLKSRHLLAFEKSQIKDIELRYVQVFIKEKLVGLVYLQLFNFRKQHVQFADSDLLISRAVKCLLPKHVPLLVCGHLFRINFQGFYFPNPSHRPLVFDAIKMFIKQTDDERPCGIIIKDCDEIFVPQNCRFSGYRFFNGDITMEIVRNPQWLTFQDYVNSLSKKYRQRARKLTEAFSPLQIKELNADAIAENANAINRLYMNVLDKQTVKMGIANTHYFVELKKDFGSRFEFYAVYEKENMVGFYTFIYYTSEMETHFIGLDYEANKKYKLYFNILFLGIEKMIERRLNKLELGRTAREAKMNAGAAPRQVFNYIKVKNWAADMALRYFLYRFNQAENNPPGSRNPFR